VDMPVLSTTTTTTTTTTQSLIEQFRYRTNSSRSLVAELSLFHDPEVLSSLDFPLTNFSRRQNLSQFVFATAADDNYFRDSLDAIGRIQLLFPNHFIYFYDLQDGDLGNESKVSSLDDIFNRNNVWILAVMTNQ